MDTPKNSRGWYVFALVALGELAYILLTVLAPHADQPNNPLKLSALQTLLLQISIIVPYMVAWIAGAYGANGFARCGEMISEKEGGRGFRQIGHGITMLVAGSMLSSIISALRIFVVQNANLTAAIAIATNYIYVLTSVLAFYFLYRGTKELVGETSEQHAHERDDRIMAGILGVIIAALYLPLVFSNPSRQVSVTPASPATYYLPDALILVSIVIPFLVAWVIGFLGALRLARYAPTGRVQSEKHSVSRLVYGLWTTLFASIFLQILVSIGSGRLLALGLGPLLILIYVFIILQIVGFIMISLGSRRMCRVVETAVMHETKPTQLV